jgi:transcriptional regulator with XRE-family HTH domain
MFNEEWLHNRVADDPGDTCEIGTPIRRAADFVNTIKNARSDADQSTEEPQSESVLGLFVFQLRRRDKLTVAQLAERLRVSPEEIETIEKNPRYGPRPRTLHQLATYSDVPANNLVRLVPDAANVDEQVEQAAYRFAASSDGLSDLSRKERRGFNDFVKFLAKYKGNDKANARSSAPD